MEDDLKLVQENNIRKRDEFNNDNNDNSNDSECNNDDSDNDEDIEED
jgi:hypothetical protein